MGYLLPVHTNPRSKIGAHTTSKLRAKGDEAVTAKVEGSICHLARSDPILRPENFFLTENIKNAEDGRK
jgi:hypothetical protein